eukprot:GHVN01085114.1.p1 GENE.GHVN01085114.1~~GHVN01085114.1.p1  ORF type:complete len:615 (+),score=149.28 GHVN01085114.1:135-1847(+)
MSALADNLFSKSTDKATPTTTPTTSSDTTSAKSAPLPPPPPRESHSSPTQPPLPPPITQPPPAAASARSHHTTPSQPPRSPQPPPPQSAQQPHSSTSPTAVERKPSSASHEPPPPPPPPPPPTQHEEKPISTATGDEEQDESKPPPPRHTHLTENETDTINVQTDTPYTAATSWEQLNLAPDLLSGIHAKGFARPSKIQEAALPLVLSVRGSLKAQAQNGSGKTATFALCMLSCVTRHIPAPQCVCMSPTRELARQNLDVIKELGKFTDCTYWLCVPKCDRYDRTMGAQIVVGTPGKMKDCFTKNYAPSKEVVMLVVDEADIMINPDNNMGGQVSQTRRCFNQDIQILLFSATYADNVAQFADRIIPRGAKIELRREDIALDTIAQFYISGINTPSAKLQQLFDLYSALTVGQSVIFVNTRQSGFDIAHKMSEAGYAVSLICGSDQGNKNMPESMDHETRERVMEEFRSGVTKVLIATDVLARGIDVPQVTLVINLNLPMNRRSGGVDFETYIHRIGRTGRFGLKGIAVNLVDEGEIRLIPTIERYYHCEIKEMPNDPDAIEDMVRQLRH